MRAEGVITQERLKEVLSYDPDTGLFTWLVDRGKQRAGRVAGSKRDSGHIVIRIDRQLYRAHQLAFLYMTGSFPRGPIDHIHGVKDDNRFSQIREATPAMNAQNIIDKPMTGVERRQCGTWRAVLKMGTKKLHVGTFATYEEAKEAYLNAKREKHPGYVERRLSVPQTCPSDASHIGRRDWTRTNPRG